MLGIAITHLYFSVARLRKKSTNSVYGTISFVEILYENICCILFLHALEKNRFNFRDYCTGNTFYSQWVNLFRLGPRIQSKS